MMEYVPIGGETFAFSIFDNMDTEIPHFAEFIKR